MTTIHLLDKNTIDKIAAGEVVDRPASVVKELLENAIDAKAGAITVEIKEGGISLIRITDNGEGIRKQDVQNAFLRHATSKIKEAADLLSIHSLGFRGEALSSIAAVSQMECISKTREDLVGTRYVIEGGEEKSIEEVGAPSGTTFIVKNLFYNTPARRKFLKTPATEASYISSIVEKIALSHPEVSLRFIANGQTKLHTSGNGKLKDIIYTIFGRDICTHTLEVSGEAADMKLTGYIGKPVIVRGNRSNMIYFINGRTIKSNVIYSAVEEAYKPYIMPHNYPFCVLDFEIAPEKMDVNVHPSKMEVRFADQIGLFNFFYETLRDRLAAMELIPEITAKDFSKSAAGKKTLPKNVTSNKTDAKTVTPTLDKPDVKAVVQDKADMLAKAADMTGIAARTIAESPAPYETETNAKMTLQMTPSKNQSKTNSLRPPEPFENNRMQADSALRQNDNNDRKNMSEIQSIEKTTEAQPTADKPSANDTIVQKDKGSGQEQLTLFDGHFISKSERIKHKLIGQLFATYWLVEYNDHLYIIDQHAAHEKVLYEQTMRRLKNKEFTSQQLNPPIILTLSMAEEELLHRFQENFSELGYEIEHFGGREYAVRAVPDNLYAIGSEQLLRSLIDQLGENSISLSSELITEKIASMSCKAAVKGNHSMSPREADALIEELLLLENPYNCPHGRPTILSMSKYELEKKFKRIL